MMRGLFGPSQQTRPTRAQPAADCLASEEAQVPAHAASKQYGDGPKRQSQDENAGRPVRFGNDEPPEPVA